jgi:hypothetical protein
LITGWLPALLRLAPEPMLLPKPKPMRWLLLSCDAFSSLVRWRLGPKLLPMPLAPMRRRKPKRLELVRRLRKRTGRRSG